MAWNLNTNGTITSVMSGKCLDGLQSGGVEVNTCDDRATQHWALSDIGGKTMIRQASGGLCLADADPSPSPAVKTSVTIHLKDLGITEAEVGLRDVWAKK